MAKGGRGRGGRRRGTNRDTYSTGASPTATASNDHRRRRGPPAIFITCEVGREGKCQREAIELIHHYYYNNAVTTTAPSNASSHINDASLTTTANDDTMLPKNDSTQQLQEEEEEPTTLSLEDELAMLRKGAAPEEVLSYFNNSNNKHNDRPNSKRSRHTSATANVTFTQQEKRQKMSNSSSLKSPFIVYDTGMRGTVCIICTIPQCELIPYDKILSNIRMLNNNNKNDENNNNSGGIGNDDEDNETATAIENTYVNKQSESTNDPTTVVVVNGNDKLPSSSSSSSIPPPLLWDPVETVRCIFHGAKNAATITDDDSNNDTDAMTRIGMNNIPPPGSRYITRMIPIQATCYASIDEIKAVSRSLLQRYLPNIYQSKKKEGDNNATTIISITFKIEIKKRLCTHLTQEELINAIAPVLLGGQEGGLLVLPPKCKFEVNLTDPDFSIRIETCKTLCGVSILPRNDWYKKFNLAELTSPTTKPATEPNKEEENNK